MDDEAREVLRASRALLGIVARSMSGALERVTVPQFRVLVLLGSLGPQRVGALAELLEVVPSTATRVLDRLERDGWVRRASNVEDRREVAVELTEEGRALVAEVTERRYREVRRVLLAMEPPARAVLAGALRGFSDVAGEPGLTDLVAFGI